MSRHRPRLASKILSLTAMLFAGAILVGTSIPANAFMTAADLAVVTDTAPQDSQQLAASADAVEAPPVRDGFTVISYAQLLAAETGKAISTDYTVTTGAIRWPFPYAVPISDGFGYRNAPCGACSSDHKGVDFTPGAGTPIYAVADGVVAEHEDDDTGFGNYVMLSHNVNGMAFDSLYAHMQTGSSPLQVGDTIKVGDFIGLVGNTGTSVGAHLHFEIHIDGTPVDPFAWLQANAIN